MLFTAYWCCFYSQAHRRLLVLVQRKTVRSVVRERFKVVFSRLKDVMVELYNRNIWKDEKTVNVITSALFSKVTKVTPDALKITV